MNIQNVVDLGCGDFLCGKLIYDDLDVNYTGYDVYADIIKFNSKNFPVEKYTFHHLDFFSKKEEIVSGDLCIIKDVLQHWPVEYIYTFLDYLVESKKFKYIFIVNCCYQRYDNTTTTLGDFRGLSCDFLPLKKYSPAKLYNYSTKEVSMITCLNE